MRACAYLGMQLRAYVHVSHNTWLFSFCDHFVKLIFMEDSSLA